jgi:hypothetical protein
MVPDNPITNPASPPAPEPATVEAAYEGVIRAFAAHYAHHAGSNAEEAERSTRFLTATRSQRDRWTKGDASPTRAAKKGAA